MNETLIFCSAAQKEYTEFQTKEFREKKKSMFVALF